MMSKAIPHEQLSMIPVAGYWEVLCWAAGKRKRFQVQGDSMLPLLMSGDEVLICMTDHLSVGDIIVARHPYRHDTSIVKYIAAQNDQGNYYVLGSNEAASSDSRHFGYLPSQLIYGRVSSQLPL